jgi:hypothetical protein
MSTVRAPPSRQGIAERLEGDQAFDQPCRHAKRVWHYAVYCHSPVAQFHKCVYRGEPASAHAADLCGDYQPNPAWSEADEASRVSRPRRPWLR